MRLPEFSIFAGLWIALGTLQHNQNMNPSPYIFETKKLPTHNRNMTSVGNGHVATVIFNDTVYMNGVYNGFKGESHRARIPSRNNIRVYAETAAEVSNHTFTLNVHKGVFTEKFNTPTHQVRLHTFAHRYFHKILVTQVHVTRTSTEAKSLTLTVTSDPGEPSSDITFDQEETLYMTQYVSFNKNFTAEAIVTCGHTNIIENPKYQTTTSTVCVAATKPPRSLIIDSHVEEAWYTFFSAYDTTNAGALEDFYAVAKILETVGGHQDLYNSHTSAWGATWDDGRIEIDGNLELAKTVNAAFYYIVSSLPITTQTHSPISSYYGLSPSGLSRGAKLKDYQGHSFWDTEIWIFPVILNFYPAKARELLQYRVNNFEVAKDHARETGWEGARFPWESAFTGSEVTPECCPAQSDLQIHVTGDISFAIKQYFTATLDIDWLTNHDQKVLNTTEATNPCNLVRAIAEFWVSRGTFNVDSKKYDINGVMPPDEDNYPVNNSVYTNIVAANSVFFAKLLEDYCLDKMGPIPEEWLEYAKSLTIPFDTTLNYHPEYDGYNIGTQIKQADVVLIGYPLLHEMDESTRRNDLKIYQNVTRSTGPAMTWAMHTIGHLEINETAEAETLFRRSYKPYLRKPFYTWTESPPPKYGANNFLTGMGGFLQAIVNGYAGLRLHHDKLVFTNPKVPPQSKQLKLIGLKYLGSSLNLIVSNTYVEISTNKTNSEIPLTLDLNGETYALNDGFEIIQSIQGSLQVTIRPSKSPSPFPSMDKF